MDDRFASITGNFQGPTTSPQTACPVCGGASSLFAQAPIIDPDHPIAVDLLQCNACRHGWISPMPRQEWLNHLYATSNQAVIRGGWENEGVLPPNISEAFMLDREKNTPAGRYFELGVGKGALYQRFMAAGWQCMGVEPGSWGKFPGIVGSIDELPADAKFDRLVAFDVLEHVERPIDFLTRMRSASVLGAKLYFSVPNIDSFRARRQRAKWRMVRPLGHTHYFSKSSVQALLKSAGFAVEVLSTNDMFRMQDLKHGLRPAVSGLLQATGQGDQMLVVAKAV